MAEAPVPQVEPAIRGKHAKALEQIVEGRGSNPKQRVARARQPDLLGPVLEDQPKATIGKRLGNDPQMIAVGKHPLFLDRFIGRSKPVAALGLPLGKVAGFRESSVLAHPLEQPVELGRLVEPVTVDLGHDREGLVVKA